MKKNFSKALLASAAISTLGLAYAAQDNFSWLSVTGEPFTVEWGVSEDYTLSEDMISLGLPCHAANNVPGGIDPNDYHFYINASLYELNAGNSDDEVDPGFSQGTPTLLKDQVDHEIFVVGGEFAGNLFPETFEVGHAYGVVLNGFTIKDLQNNVTYTETSENWANPTLTFEVVPAVSEALEIAPAFISGEDEISINNHSAISVESAEALVVRFINGVDVKTATYAIDQLEEDNALSLASGELSINTIGYVAFEQPLTFISGFQYKLTVKAWDTTDIVDENLNVMEPIAVEEYVFNGAAATGLIGEPVFGVERGQFPEDMCMLGVPVRFPEMILPFGVVAEDCEITVSASLFEVQPDEETSVEVGVTGPICLAEAQLHVANIVGGVASAMLFPEMMVANKHYAIALDAVTVMDAEGNIVAELPEDAYYAVEFDVTPYVAPIELGWAEFVGIENGVVDVEDTMIHGVKVTFPAANFGTDDAVLSVMATLYDVTDMGQLAGDDIDNMGVVGPVAVAQQLFVGGLNVESGIYEVALFTEQFVAGRKYVISLETITAETQEGEVILSWDNTDEEWATDIFEVISTALEIAPAFIAGEEQIALNDHSAVSVETAEALVVRFINGVDIKMATYAIDMLEEDNAVSLASGEISINTIGYVAFEQPLTFVSGNQYKLTIKAWDTTDVLDENLNVVDPMAAVEYVFNGASANGIIGEPVFGISRGQFEEDMINLGVPVRFPEMLLPFGVVAEDCEITVSASLFEVQPDEETSVEVGVTGPICLAEAQLHTASVVGGVVSAMLFPEMMEVGKHYAIALDAVTVMDAEGNIVAELPVDAYYAVEFDVIPAAPVYGFGQPEWYLDGSEEEGYTVADDQAVLGVTLAFPEAVIPEDATCVADVMLYGIMPAGAEGGIMPLSADDDIDPGFNNVPTVLPLYDAPVQVVGFIEGGVLRFSLAAEDLALGNYYAIEVSKVAAIINESEAMVVTDITSPVFCVVPAMSEELEIAPAFIAGEDQVALNTHSAVSVETAEALVVRFVNGVDVKMATYAIDMIEEDNLVSIASGELSINTIGYVAFDKALTFVSGYQYKLTVKAWDTTDVLDEEFNVMEPIAAEEYIFNGASAAGIIGEPVFGVTRGQFEDDMLALGVPVRFPELLLPFGVVAEECEITVSASLYEVQPDEETSVEVGVTGPICLAEAQVHNAYVSGGVVTAMLFPEMMEVGKHYAIAIEAVTVMDAEGEIVAELSADDYFAVDFDVVPAAPVYAFGEPVWALEGDEETGYMIGSDQANLGVVLEFPFAEVPAEAVCVAEVMLYGIMPAGAEGGIMPLSADDDIDPGFNNVPTVLPLYDEPMKVYANDEGGVIRFNIAAEDLAIGNYYAIEVSKVSALVNDVEVMSVEGINSPVFNVYEVLPEEPMEIAPAFIAGEEQIALNSHSAVSVETAEALVVNFVNGPMVKYATYAIDEYVYDENEGEMVWNDQLGSGALSLSTMGYVAFDPALTFVAGHMYILTVKAWDVESIFDENWNMAEPIAAESFVFNGASAEATLGEPVWGVERGQFSEDMINLGLPVSFPELSLPFGVVPEECAIVVWASLVEEGAEDDEIDPGFGFNSEYFFATVEGGVVTAYLFPEELEVGKTYTINLLGVQFYTMDLQEMILEIEGNSGVTFTVVPSEGGDVSISNIKLEGAKEMYNLNGQKINNANGVVIFKGVKALVK